MRTFAILRMPEESYIVTANPDGTIPLSARCVARQDKPGDPQCIGLRAIVEQANLVPVLVAALRHAEKLAWEVGSESEDGVLTILEDSRGDLWREVTAAIERAESLGRPVGAKLAGDAVLHNILKGE